MLKNLEKLNAALTDAHNAWVAVCRTQFEWKEHEHPRDNAGKFAKKPGGGPSKLEKMVKYLFPNSLWNNPHAKRWLDLIDSNLENPWALKKLHKAIETEKLNTIDGAKKNMLEKLGTVIGNAEDLKKVIEEQEAAEQEAAEQEAAENTPTKEDSVHAILNSFGTDLSPNWKDWIRQMIQDELNEGKSPVAMLTTLLTKKITESAIDPKDAYLKAEKNAVDELLKLFQGEGESDESPAVPESVIPESALDVKSVMGILDKYTLAQSWKDTISEVISNSTNQDGLIEHLNTLRNEYVAAYEEGNGNSFLHKASAMEELISYMGGTLKPPAPTEKEKIVAAATNALSVPNVADPKSLIGHTPETIFKSWLEIPAFKEIFDKHPAIKQGWIDHKVIQDPSKLKNIANNAIPEEITIAKNKGDTKKVAEYGVIQAFALGLADAVEQAQIENSPVWTAWKTHYAHWDQGDEVAKKVIKSIGFNELSEHQGKVALSEYITAHQNDVAAHDLLGSGIDSEDGYTVAKKFKSQIDAALSNVAKKAHQLDVEASIQGMSDWVSQKIEEWENKDSPSASPTPSATIPPPATPAEEIAAKKKKAGILGNASIQPKKGKNVEPDVAAEFYKDWKKSLTHEEHSALSEYWGSGFKYVNGYLRGKEHYKDSPEGKALDKKLEKALSKMTTPEDLIVHRNVSWNALVDIWDHVEPGDFYEDKGYTSTSVGNKSHFGGGVQLTIHVPKGTQGGYIGSELFPGNPHNREHELLLMKGLRYKIISKEKGDSIYGRKLVVQVCQQGECDYGGTATPILGKPAKTPKAKKAVTSVPIPETTPAVAAGSKSGSSQKGQGAFPESLRNNIASSTSLGGSTGAKLVQTTDGKQFVLKKGAHKEHLLNEVQADNIYKAAGVSVPDFHLYNEGGNTPAKASAYLGEDWAPLNNVDKKLTEQAHKQLQANFALDAILGNWDVIGQDHDNIMVNKKTGQVMRIDNGGALEFRAQGKKKAKSTYEGEEIEEFGEEVWDFLTMRDPAKNPSAAAVYGGIKDSQIKKQLVTLKAKWPQIISAVKSPKLKNLLNKRMAWSLEAMDIDTSGLFSIIPETFDVPIMAFDTFEALPESGVMVTTEENFPDPVPRKFMGLKVMVENPAGSVRRGKSPEGMPWETHMLNDYGFLSKGVAEDGEGLDVYLGKDEAAENAYVVHQNNPDTDKYDEDKVMLGFDSPDEAKKAYLAHYDSPDFFRSMTIIPMHRFKSMLTGGEVGGVHWKKKHGREHETAAMFSTGLSMNDVLGLIDRYRKGAA